jgi:hypothetical protein
MKEKQYRNANHYMSTLARKIQGLVLEHYFGWPKARLIEELFDHMPSKPVEELVSSYLKGLE